MKIYSNLYFFIIIFGFSSFAQVGINTAVPTNTLDVNGTARIRTTNSGTATKLTGTDANGQVTDMNIDATLSISAGVLSAKSNNTKYNLATITDNFANQTKNNYDLLLNTTNQNATVFFLVQSPGGSQATTITGLAGGTNGRIVILKSDAANFNINISNQSTQSTDINRFALSGDLNINSFGTYVFVYWTFDNRWHLIDRYLN